MRLSFFFPILLSLTTLSHASWFGNSDSPQPYQDWSVDDLKSWLRAHGIPLPSKQPTQTDLRNTVQDNWDKINTWSFDQYTSAQKSFNDVRATTFDKWDESRLRQFLLEQGILAPKGPKEQLILLAKSQYRAYQSAASSFSDRASSTIYGDSAYQATKSLSSLAQKATASAVRTAEDAKDYVYSTWEDSEIIDYLRSKGVKVQDNAQKSRSHLLALMHDSYAKVTDPIYKAWSDSYLRYWLVHHNIIAPEPPSPYSREFLLSKMKEYYYDANDTVYSTWTDSQLREWLIHHGIIKSDAQVKREKMVKLVEDNYIWARDTTTSAWSDSQMRDWLVEHGYIDDRNVAQMKRDELVNLLSEKYHSATRPSYLAWPDARLRAYLRQNNVPEDRVPTSRPGLLQEARILYVRTENTSEALWAKVKETVSSVEEGVEERLWRVWNMLKGSYGQSEDYVEEKYAESKAKAGEAYADGEKEYEREKERAYEKAQDARERVGENVKVGGQKIKGEL